MKRRVGMTVAAALSVALAACTPNISPDSYSVGAVGQVNRAVGGVIVSARPVAVEGTRSGLGAGAGAVAGGVAGSTIGGNTEANIVAAVGGAVVGGLAGAAIEESATSQTAMEYVVEAENGALLTVVQGGSPLPIGLRVLVIYGSRARIIPKPNP